jgi:transposase
MKNDLYLGNDVGKKISVLFAVDKQTGEIVLDARRMQTNNMEEWRKLLAGLREKYVLHLAFEVGPHYDWMYDLFKEFAAEVVVVNAALFGVITKSHKKTDKVDARKLAEGLLRGDLPDVCVPDKETRADRRLVSFVHYSSQQLSSLKGRLRGLLQTFRLECPQTNILSKSATQWLKEKARPQLDEDGQMVLDMLLEQAALLRQHRAQLDGKVKERVQRYSDAATLRSVPGFGPLVSLAVLCAVAGVSRFKQPRQLSSYLGVCNGVRQSGQGLAFTGLTKAGNPHVRWLLAQALLHVLRKDPKARARYLKLKRRKGSGVARGAMLRWLTIILWHVLTKHEAYRLAGKQQKGA